MLVFLVGPPLTTAGVGTGIAAIVEADYRMDGRTEIMCCSTDGEVKGYLPSDANDGGTVESNSNMDDIIRDLHEKKSQLEHELKSYKEGLTQMKSKGKTSNAQLIPPTTQVLCKLLPSEANQCCEIHLATNNDTVIQLAAVYADGIFEGAPGEGGESFVVHRSRPSCDLVIPLAPPRDASAELSVKVLVGTGASSLFHEFDLEVKLPKFSMYVPQNLGAESFAVPESYVAFELKERINRVAIWVAEAFTTSEGCMSQDAGSLRAAFVSLRTGRPLVIEMSNTGQVKVHTDSIEVAGEVVQDLCVFIGEQELSSTAHFPLEMETFKEILDRVSQFNETRLRMTAEMADSSQLVKSLVIKAEDARILGDMVLMRQFYSQLSEVNGELIAEHTKLSRNHVLLLEHLKRTNSYIQMASKLRVGKERLQLVAQCRKAIKAGNTGALTSILVAS